MAPSEGKGERTQSFWPRAGAGVAVAKERVAARARRRADMLGEVEARDKAERSERSVVVATGRRASKSGEWRRLLLASADEANAANQRAGKADYRPSRAGVGRELRAAASRLEKLVSGSLNPHLSDQPSHAISLVVIVARTDRPPGLFFSLTGDVRRCGLGPRCREPGVRIALAACWRHLHLVVSTALGPAVAVSACAELCVHLIWS